MFISFHGFCLHAFGVVYPLQKLGPEDHNRRSAEGGCRTVLIQGTSCLFSYLSGVHTTTHFFCTSLSWAPGRIECHYLQHRLHSLQTAGEGLQLQWKAVSQCKAQLFHVITELEKTFTSKMEHILYIDKVVGRLSVWIFTDHLAAATKWQKHWDTQSLLLKTKYIVKMFPRNCLSVIKTSLF